MTGFGFAVVVVVVAVVVVVVVVVVLSEVSPVAVLSSNDVIDADAFEKYVVD
jgi:uncharacterized membrane protein